MYKVIHDPNACRTWLAVFGDTSPRYKAEESIKGTCGHQNSPSLCDVSLHNQIKQTQLPCTGLHTSKQHCGVWARKGVQLLLTGQDNFDDQKPHQLVDPLACRCNLNWEIPLASWVVCTDFLKVTNSNGTCSPWGRIRATPKINWPCIQILPTSFTHYCLTALFWAISSSKGPGVRIFKECSRSHLNNKEKQVNNSV